MFDRSRARTASKTDPEEVTNLRALNWRRLLSYLTPYWGRMAVAILALLVSSGLGLAFPLVIVRLLDSVTTQGNLAALNTLALSLVALFLVQAGFSFLQNYLLALIGERITFDLRTSLYRHLHRLSLAFYSNRRVGEIVSRLSSDVTQMRTVLTTNLTSLLSQLFTLVGALIIVLATNGRLTLFILALIPALLLVAFTFGRRIQKASLGVQDRLADSTTIAEEGLQGIRIVKSFGREDHEVGRYTTAMQATFQAALRVALYNSAFGTLMGFLGFGAIAAIMWYGGREVIAGRLSLGMITGFLVYGIAIATSLAGLAGLYGQLRGALGGVQRVFELLDLQPAVEDAPTAVALPAAQGRLTFTNVAFSYEANAPVIQDVSLDIRAGEILALVGPSGAGKSTLFNLIPRFYDPTSGQIALDGHDLRGLTQASLRAQMAIVPQETMLFGGSIRDNILYGRLDATEAEVIAAATAANAHDFISAFPQGYDTLVGERGAKLSGGQRQRVAIARAILKNPRLLLLDEATSSLDNESEGLVQEALERLMRGRTTVIIAHRLSTIKVADRIAVLEAGRLTELGTHADLLAAGGTYARLYNLQFRDPQAAELAPSPLPDATAPLAASDLGPRRPPEKPTGLLGAFGLASQR